MSKLWIVRVMAKSRRFVRQNPELARAAKVSWRASAASRHKEKDDV
jgi:hypothetical protein